MLVASWLEPFCTTLSVGNVGQYVAFFDLETFNRDSLWMDELNGVDGLDLGDEDGRAQPVHRSVSHKSHWILASKSQTCI